MRDIHRIVTEQKKKHYRTKKKNPIETNHAVVYRPFVVQNVLPLRSLDKTCRQAQNLDNCSKGFIVVS